MKSLLETFKQLFSRAGAGVFSQAILSEGPGGRKIYKNGIRGKVARDLNHHLYPGGRKKWHQGRVEKENIATSKSSYDITSFSLINSFTIINFF